MIIEICLIIIAVSNLFDTGPNLNRIENELTDIANQLRHIKDDLRELEKGDSNE